MAQVLQRPINRFINNTWNQLPDDNNVANRLTAAWSSGVLDAEGTFSTKSSDLGFASRLPYLALYQSNEAFLRLVQQSAQPFVAAHGYVSTRPGDGLFSHGNDKGELRYEGDTALHIIASVQPFLVKRAYVASLVTEWGQTPLAQRTQQQEARISQLQRCDIWRADWQAAGAPSADVYLPVQRIVNQQAAGGWSTDQKRQYIAGMFDGDGSVCICKSGRVSRLQASITQKGCPELLDAIQQHLGYGRLYSDSVLTFIADEVRWFWEDVVLDHSVIKVHKYAVMLKLCFCGASAMAADPTDAEPGPYYQGRRINCKTDGHAKQNGVNWTTALQGWTGGQLVKPAWAT